MLSKFNFQLSRRLLIKFIIGKDTWANVEGEFIRNAPDRDLCEQSSLVGLELLISHSCRTRPSDRSDAVRLRIDDRSCMPCIDCIIVRC